MNTADEILELALQLPQTERASVAHQLLLSLEPDGFDADHEAAWNAAIEARLARVARGEFSASAWREALGRIRASLVQRPTA